MAQMTPEQLTAFLVEPNIAHFVTVRADGSPHAVPLWYEYVDGDFYIFTPSTSFKLKNLARDLHMTLSIASEAKPYRYVVANGTAEILEGDVGERVVSIASRYEGAEGGAAYYESLKQRFKVVVIKLTPTHSREWISG
jgi:PPOX class probable F420-dependent enzyme